MAKFTPAVQELENTFAERQTGPFVDRGGSVGFDVRAYGAVLDGASDNAAALNAALAAAQTAGVRVVTVAGGAARIASNVTIPSGVTLRVLEGATIKPAAGATLTINGTFDAGLYSVFDLSEGGSVVLGRGAVEYVVPQWWGAVGDGVTDDTAAIQAAIDAAAPNRTTTSWTIERLAVVFVPPGDWLIDGQLILPEGVLLQGAGPYATRLILGNKGWSNTAPKIRDANFDYVTNSKNLGIRDLSLLPDIRVPTTHPSGAAFMEFRNVTELLIHNVRILMHKFPFGGDTADYRGIILSECAVTDIENLVGDFGDYLIISKPNTNRGVNLGRFRNIYAYRQKECGVLLQSSSKNYFVGLQVDFPVDRGGLGRPLTLDAASHENTVVGGAIQTLGEHGILVDGDKNCISGLYVRNGKAGKKAIKLGGNNNIVTGCRVSGAGGDFEDTGANNRFNENSAANDTLTARGNANIVAGTTFVDVALSGLPKTPSESEVYVYPKTSPAAATKWWVNNITQSGFRINVDTDPGTTITFRYEVRVGS